MKNILLLLALLVAGLNSFAQRGNPFAPYNESGYLISESAKIVASDSVLALEFTNVLQKIGEHDGWIDSIPNKKMTVGYAIFILQKLTVKNLIWKKGDISIGSRLGNNFIYFCRESYSDRVKKVAGAEPVGMLDITAIFGWKDSQGNSFPQRVVMMLRCINSAIETDIAECNGSNPVNTTGSNYIPPVNPADGQNKNLNQNQNQNQNPNNNGNGNHNQNTHLNQNKGGGGYFNKGTNPSLYKSCTNCTEESVEYYDSYMQRNIKIEKWSDNYGNNYQRVIVYPY